MKFWFVCLVVVFSVTELYQWLQGLTLPLPLYGAAGLLLALLSNADQWLPRLPEGEHSESKPFLPQTEAALDTDRILSGKPSEEPFEEAALPPVLHVPQASAQSEPQLPNLPVAAPPPISFTIRKP